MAEVLRIVRDLCGKWCKGSARWRREFTSACGSLHLTPFHFIPTRPDRRMESWGREFPNRMTI